MAKSPEGEAAQGLAAEPFSGLPFFDNPAFGRALRYTFGEKRLGRAVFVNALFLVIALGAVQEIWSRGVLGPISEKLPFGRAAFLACALVETFVVTALGPISFMHLFNAERREDCFDQVVASGCSPLRILMGRYAAMLAFVAVTALSALPFFVFSASVLRGATAGDVLTFYCVLGAYSAAIGAATLATTIAIEDAAFPGVFALIASLSAIVPAFSRYLPAAFAAWSPVRHLTVQLAEIPRSMGLGEILEPSLFGVSFNTAAFSCALYLGLVALSLAYVCVGPDLELADGLDSFASVTLKRGGDASRGRRGIAATLLRNVQLRFFYENLGDRARTLGPFLRLATMLALFLGGHVIVLGTFWPKTAPRSWVDLELKTFQPYYGFTVITIGLMALASAGAKASILAREPLLRLGSFRLGRFPALFILVAGSLAIPPLLFGLAVHRAGLPLDGPDGHRALALYGLVALYAAFCFALALVWAMLTTNHLSAMGSTLMVLLVANLLPLGWVPLFASNLATEESARVLDTSPIFAVWSVFDPTDEIPFNTVRDEQTVSYQHKPTWRPYVLVHAPVALLLLGAGLFLARRERRRRLVPPAAVPTAGALAALVLALVPADARAQEASTPQAPIRVELETGLGGKVPVEGFTPFLARIENASDHDASLVLTVKEPTTGAILARSPGAVPVPRDHTAQVRFLGAAEPVHDAATLLVEASTEDGTVVATGKARVDPLPRGDRLLVVLDRHGSLPFALQGSLKSADEGGPRRLSRRGRGGSDAATWTPSYVARVEDLPQSELGWSGAGAVLVGDLDLDQLGTAAARALAGWVARGGDLVLVAGDRAPLLRRKSELAAALGDALDGLPDAPPRRQVSLAPVLASIDPALENAELASAVALLAPTPRDQVLARGAQGEPLSYRRGCGLGRLTVLAFDPWQPPLVHQDATARLLEQSLGRPNDVAVIETLHTELSQLRVQPARIGPAFAALLIYALVIGPGIYFALRPSKRGLIAWVAIPVGALVTAALTPLYKIVLARTESAVVTGSVVQVTAGDPWEVETADAIVFSGGVEDHDLAVRGKDVTAATLVARGFRAGTAPRLGDALGQPGAARTSLGPAEGLSFELKVPLWGSRHVFGDRVTQATAPRIAGRLSLRAKGTFVEIENAGREPLEDPIVVYPEFRAQPGLVEHELGATLGAGAKVASLVAQGNLAAPQTPGHSKEVSELLERRVLDGPARATIELARGRVAVLVARLPDRANVVEARANVRVRASGAVLLARLPFVFEEKVPFGLASVVREEREIAAVGSGTAGAIVETRVQLPPGAGTGRAPERLRLSITSGGRPLETKLSLRDARTGEWVAVDLATLVQDQEGAIGPGTIVRLPDPGRFLDASGLLVARQTLEAGAGRRDGGPAELDVSADWAAAEGH